MSIVKINALTVPEGMGEILEERFAARAGEVEKVDGFESFELLRPTEGIDKYLVVTRWADEDSFLAWMNSPAFERGHARAGGAAGEGDAPAAEGTPEGTGRDDAQTGHHAGHGDGTGSGDDGEASPRPAASGAELWGFEIVTSATKQE